MDLIAIATELAQEVDGLDFGPPVSYVYNPLGYARAAHEEYLRRYGQGQRDVVLLGMNPGPWGMAQTGVPFGEVAAVQDWLGITTSIGKPPREHPKRLVEGFACRRSEVSGKRLWAWARQAFVTPDRFFARFLVLNYCPLVFIESGGRNRTPDRLPAKEKKPLMAACDRALVAAVEYLKPHTVVGIGRFARLRATAALGDSVRVAEILHPSPASPAANRGWAEQISGQLAAIGCL